MHTTLRSLVNGALVAGSLLAGLYFFKFWQASRDALFIWFAVAFWLLALQRLLLALSGAAVESQTHLFLLRLLAYVMFPAAIIQKNRQERDRSLS